MLVAMTAGERDGSPAPLVVAAGAETLTPTDRAADRDVVATVDAAALAAVGAGGPAAARVLAAVRRADLLAPATGAVADALASIVPVGPWDMAVGLGSGPDGAAVDAALARRRPRPGRPRHVAFVTPLPPDATGVAGYSHRLAEALARRARVTCVVTGPVTDDRRPAGAVLTTVDDLGALVRSGTVDEVVYALGNHPAHGTQLALLRRWPGAVQLHDVRLVGAYAGLHAPGDPLADEVQRIYPGRFDRALLRDGELTMGPAVAAGLWLVREVAALATTVLTHSAYAAALVAGDARVTPACIGPLAHPAVAPRAAPSAHDEALVVSVGAVDESKRCAVLVDALAALPAARRPRLALVGPVAPAYRARLQRLAAERGVDDRLVLTGWVPDHELDAWLRRAAVAVQLRGPSNGESSAAVAECVARGVPTIVSDGGALGELPGDAVVHVPADVDAAGLAAELDALLGDVDLRAALHRAALAHAAANGFDAAAERLLAALFSPDR